MPRRPSRRQASARILGAMAGLTVGSVAVAVLCAIAITSAIAGRTAPLVGLVAAAVIVSLIWVLLSRRRPGRELGERVTIAAQPSAWRITSQAAVTMGLRAPDEVRITLWPVISLSQRARLASRSYTVLRVGLPALALLDEAQLRVLIAATLDAQRGHAALLVTGPGEHNTPSSEPCTDGGCRS